MYRISGFQFYNTSEFDLAELVNDADHMLDHVSAATTLDIYTHITDDMRLTAAANIDRGIGKATPQDDTSEPGQETAPAQVEKPRMTDFKPYVGRKRRSGTGCVTEINDHLFEGRYSPKWPDGKKHARNVYAHTREECEEMLKVLIVEMKAEIAEAKRLMAEGGLHRRHRRRIRRAEESEDGVKAQVKKVSPCVRILLHTWRYLKLKLFVDYLNQIPSNAFSKYLNA